MKIKLLKGISARQIHLSKIAAGSVLDIDMKTAIYLSGRGFAELVDAPKPEPKAQSAPQVEEAEEAKPKKAKKSEG